MRIKQLKEGYKVLPAINKERYPEISGLEGPFRTLNGGVLYYDPKEGAYYDKDRDMYLSYDEFRQMDTDYSDMKDERDEVEEGGLRPSFAKELRNKELNKDKGPAPTGKTTGPDDYDFLKYKNKKNDKPESNKDINEISPDLAKRYTKAAKMDREFNDDDITRLAKSGQSTQDMHKRNSKRMKGIRRAAKSISKVDEAAMKGDYARIMYDYREDYYNITVYKNGKEAVDDDGYFGANETGNPLIKKFTDAVEQAGLIPEGLPIMNEKGQTGVFTNGKFQWHTNESVTLDYSRYMRSHGKKPRDTHGGGIWMFTTTDMGEPTEDDMFEFQGSFADAKKAAAKWARSQGAYRFFVMEDNFKKKETELAEAPKSILDDPALQARIARSKEDVAKRKPAMDKALKSIEMTFGPERKAVTDQIGAMTRAADMMTSERWADRALSVVERYGINSKEQLAQEIRIMIDNERELEGHEYIVGADRNVKQLQAALEKLSGLEEGIFNHKDNVIISVMDKNGKPVDRLTARAASSKYRVPVSQILGQTRTQDFAQIGDHYFGVAPVQESSEDPCWNDYKQIGTKKKNGKEVPNCVPKNNKREK